VHQAIAVAKLTVSSGTAGVCGFVHAGHGQRELAGSAADGTAGLEQGHLCQQHIGRAAYLDRPRAGAGVQQVTEKGVGANEHGRGVRGGKGCGHGGGQFVGGAWVVGGWRGRGGGWLGRLGQLIHHQQA